MCPRRGGGSDTPRSSDSRGEGHTRCDPHLCLRPTGRSCAPTLPREPFRESLLNFSVAHHPPGFHIGETLFDLLADVDVVLNVLERSVLRQHAEDLLDLFLRRFHDLRFYRGAPEGPTKAGGPSSFPRGGTKRAQCFIPPSRSDPRPAPSVACRRPCSSRERPPGHRARPSGSCPAPASTQPGTRCVSAGTQGPQAWGLELRSSHEERSDPTHRLWLRGDIHKVAATHRACSRVANTSAQFREDDGRVRPSGSPVALPISDRTPTVGMRGPRDTDRFIGG